MTTTATNSGSRGWPLNTSLTVFFLPKEGKKTTCKMLVKLTTAHKWQDQPDGASFFQQLPWVQKQV